MPRFTRAQAEALLPKVRPLVEDLQRRARTFRERPSEPLAAEIRAVARDIADLGVEVKDPETGLVDFPAVRRGKQIYLCWKLGEGERITWWHDLTSGYAGRKLIED
jgi:hypothetical protein